MPTKRIFRLILSEARTYQLTIETLEAQLQLREEGAEDLLQARRGLLNLLRQRQDGNLDRLFRLLGLRYQPADIIPIYRGLQASDHQEKISALEFLDILLENNLKRLLIPLVEQSVRISEIAQVKPATDASTLRDRQFVNLKRILRGKDVRLKLAAIYLIGFLFDERYMPLLSRQLESGDKRIRDMAGVAFDRILKKVL